MEPLSAIAAATIPAALAYSAWRKAPLCLTFAVAMLATFGLGIAASRIDPPAGLGRFWLDLAVWRVAGSHSGPLSYITMMFVHVDLVHILLNLVFLVLVGPLLEERIGSLRWAVLFLVGGVVSTVAFEATRFQSPSYVLLGASGALSSVFGAFGRLYPRERLSIWLPIPLPPLPAIYYVVGYAVVEFFLAIIPLGPGFPQVAWEAHIAGLAFGFAAAPLAMRIPTRRGKEEVRDFSALRPLASGRELDEILGHLSKEPLPEVQRAWLERFAAAAECPQCHRPLRFTRGTLRSECGWRLRVL